MYIIRIYKLSKWWQLSLLLWFLLGLTNGLLGALKCGVKQSQVKENLFFPSPWFDHQISGLRVNSSNTHRQKPGESKVLADGASRKASRTSFQRIFHSCGAKSNFNVRLTTVENEMVAIFLRKFSFLFSPIGTEKRCISFGIVSELALRFQTNSTKWNNETNKWKRANTLQRCSTSFYHFSVQFSSVCVWLERRSIFFFDISNVRTPVLLYVDFLVSYKHSQDNRSLLNIGHLSWTIPNVAHQYDKLSCDSKWEW